MDLQQYMGPLIVLTVLLGLCIGAYYVFRNSSLGKFMGSIFGDLNGMTDWLADQFKDCSQNGLTSSSCSLGPWIIGGAVILGLFLLLKGASLLKPFLPEGTRKFAEQFGEDSAQAIQDFKTAEARFNEAFENGTLSTAEKNLLDTYKDNPTALQGVKDALIKSGANSMTYKRRLETIKEKGSDPAADKAITDAVTEQTVQTRADIADEAKENDVDTDDPEYDAGVEAAENAA